MKFPKFKPSHILIVLAAAGAAYLYFRPKKEKIQYTLPPDTPPEIIEPYTGAS